MANRHKSEIISNDDLYKQFPEIQDAILDRNPDIITEDNYTSVAGFRVVMQNGSPSEFHSVVWDDGSETPLTDDM